MSVDQHYENFPVASVLVPPHIRAYVIAIYRFARFADDIADEGDFEASVRTARLNEIADELASMWRGEKVATPAVNGLRTLRNAQIAGVTEQLFQDLLSAFKQDVTKQRYQSRGELLDYSRRSANPIGRLMLALVSVQTTTALAQSDAVCSALQLINFWQDAAIDASRGRIYVPLDEFALLNLPSENFPQHPLHRELIRAQCAHARELLLSGVPLLTSLNGRFRWEIAFTIAGGQRILEKIAANNFDVRKRPTLRWYDSLRLTWLATRHLRRSPTA
jgi:squalene synthase HpnC